MTYRCLLLAFSLLTLLTASGCGPTKTPGVAGAAAKPMTTFYLVRHAEKDYGDDPILIPKGVARAERLKETLKNVELAAIYSTDTKRTMSTARPTAEDHGLKIIKYRPELLRELSDKLKTLYRGKAVLIVGHSNTTPAMTNYLADTDRFPRFSELDYTNLYIVNLPRGGTPNVQKLRY